RPRKLRQFAFPEDRRTVTPWACAWVLAGSADSTKIQHEIEGESSQRGPGAISGWIPVDTGHHEAERQC
ncbi:MAG: hypothetical protein L0G22_12910, partial [Propionibacteriaceae bacterium]|nr:hypothetical protein [Propionibacteriaceae bacterium]